MRAGLLKRLNGEDVLQGDIQALADVIARDLQELLNVRIGSCASRPDLGLPVVSPVRLQGDAAQNRLLAQVMQLQVSHFEPRLLTPRMSFDDTGQGVLIFKLHAALEQGYERCQVGYQIQINSDSRVNISCLSLQPDGSARGN